MIPLFERFPRLQAAIPHVELGDFPTPVAKLERLGQAFDIPELYVKRDDLSGRPYGGNKVRKLEFLLAEAVRRNAKSVMTFGVAGSNHALATTVYARKLGLASISMLTPQTNARYVRANLLLGHVYGALLHQYPREDLVPMATRYQRIKHRLATGTAPYVIAGGGSSPLGTVGFVNAAFELLQQVAAGKLPEPDLLYIPLGTMGTAVGLLLGIKAAGMKTRVVVIRVVRPQIGNEKKLRELFRATNALLHAADPAFPELALDERDYIIRHEFFGTKYAAFTAEGMEAASRLRDSEGLKLDGTYTAKACAALLSDLERGELRDRRTLFWNTYNSRDFSGEIAEVDYRCLPKPFHRYFEQEVQPLDRNPG